MAFKRGVSRYYVLGAVFVVFRYERWAASILRSEVLRDILSPVFRVQVVHG